MLVVNLTKEERDALIQWIDIALKQIGLGGASTALLLAGKLQKAQELGEEEKK